MRRLFVVAAIVAVLGVVPLFGQMRGGRAGASFGRGFSSSHRSGFAGGGFGFNRGGFGGSRFFSGRGPFVSRGRPFFFGGRSAFIGGPFIGGSFYWGPDYDPYYAYPYAYGPPVPAPPSYYAQDEYYDHGDVRRDIEELNGKIDHLQRDMDSRTHVPRPQARQQEAVRQSTTLVFKDKHREDVQNYAVVGGTLWILDENKASKISLEDLDVEATTRVNDERGVEFDVPR